MNQSKEFSFTIGELFYDYDELCCMYEQLIAIWSGWADPVRPFISIKTDLLHYKLQKDEHEPSQAG